jgi:hypothetical protein
MTNQQHQITPPPELVQQWFNQAHESADPDNQLSCFDFIATAAAQWGADQELEACIEWQKCHLHSGSQLNKQLRAARRPKPPSLKDQALEALERQTIRSIPSLVSNNDCDTIRRALEQLND